MNAHQNDTPILRAEHFIKYLTGRKILDDCSISMRPGDVKVLIGPSGAGKSTFLQCINCLLEPDQGEIWLGDHRVDVKNTKELCDLRECDGIIFQEFDLLAHLTAENNVALALRKVRGMSRADALERAHAELARVGLGDKAKLYPAQLSGGQKQRVAIARALAMDPTILLLDEPTSALDPELVGEVLTVIRDLAAHGMPMIMVTHQMEFARAVATEILFMEAGKVIEQGSPEELLAPGAQTRTQNFCTRLHDLCGESVPEEQERN